MGREEVGGIYHIYSLGVGSLNALGPRGWRCVSPRTLALDLVSYARCIPVRRAISTVAGCVCRGFGHASECSRSLSASCQPAAAHSGAHTTQTHNPNLRPCASAVGGADCMQGATNERREHPNADALAARASSKKQMDLSLAKKRPLRRSMLCQIGCKQMMMIDGIDTEAPACPRHKDGYSSSCTGVEGRPRPAPPMGVPPIAAPSRLELWGYMVHHVVHDRGA